MGNRIDAILRECQPYTMIEPERLRANIRLMQQLVARRRLPDGAIVECGVWRGGMSLAASSVFGSGRRYYLFDSFEGLPMPSCRDGDDAHYWASHPEHPRYFDNCRAEEQVVRETIARLRRDFEFVVVKGWFNEILPLTETGPVAFLHLDCDWYDSTYESLSHFWNRVVPGGTILIDDYYDWQGCRQAVHEFLARQRAREAIRTLGKHGGAVITRLGQWSLPESPHLL